MTGRSRARDRSRPSGGALAWSPWSALGGQWFDATDGTSGSPVSAWTARGATATATQGTVAKQPAAPAVNVNLGNELACAFDGGDILVSGTEIDLSAGWTLVSVLRFGALRNWTGIARVSTGETTGAGASDGVVLYADSGGGLVIASPNASSWFRTMTSVSSNTSYAFVATCSGSSASIVIERGTISGGSITWSTLSLSALSGTFGMPSSTGRYLQPGGGWNTAGSPLVGDLALTGAIGRAISADEKTALRSYLAGRFAV